VLASEISALSTSTSNLQLQINLLYSDTAFLQSEIDAVNQSGIDTFAFASQCCSNLSSATNTLQIEINNTNIALASQIDLLNATTALQRSAIAAVSSALVVAETAIGVLYTTTALQASAIAAVTTAARTFSFELAVISTSTAKLQSEIDALRISSSSCCSMLATSTGYLQSQIDHLASSSAIQSQFAQLNTATIFLQNEITSCCDMLTMETIFLQSQINTLQTSTGALQSQIGVLSTSTTSINNALISCCDMLTMETIFLQSEINTLQTSTGILQSQIDIISTLTGPGGGLFLQSEINALNTSTTNISNQSQSCCSALSTSTGLLQSEIDVINGNIGELCTILVTGTVSFNIGMLPAANQTIIFKFDPCYLCNEIPTLLFDPIIFGNGGVVELQPCSRMLFEGDGIVALNTGTQFAFTGTPFDPLMSNWPQLIVQDGARIQIATGATVTFGGLPTAGGAGTLILRRDAHLIQNSACHVIFGQSTLDELSISVAADSMIMLNDPNALLTFRLGTFDIIFDNHSALSILMGTVEMNMFQGAGVVARINQAAIIRTLQFTNGSSLEIQSIDPSLTALLRVAPNADNVTVDFDNLTGFVEGGGNFEFKEFDSSGNILVDSTLVIQDQHFSVDNSILEIFMKHTYLLQQNVIERPDSTILVQLGTLPNPNEQMRLSAFAPLRNGKILRLFQGDHDLFYTSSAANETFDLMKGIDFKGRLFTIFNSDETTRVPPGA